MLILLSPAKTLDMDPTDLALHTQPEALADSRKLIDVMRKKSAGSVAKLMGLSPKLAELNVERYRDYETPFTLNQGSKQALLAFKGDVYRDWPHDSYSEEDYHYAQDHLRILSGLYGALRPMDLIFPYRLEMGTKLKTRRGKTLYDFWGSRITAQLNEALQAQGDRTVVNLASNEYFKSVKVPELKAELVTPTFLDTKNGATKIISFFAKKARGQMAHWIIKERVTSPVDLRTYTLDGYAWDASRSLDNKPTFVRVH